MTPEKITECDACGKDTCAADCPAAKVRAFLSKHAEGRALLREVGVSVVEPAPGEGSNVLPFRPDETVPPEADLEVDRCSDLTARKLKWLWRGYIAYGKLTIFEGDPGLGKSTVLTDLAARKTKGEPMPGETAGGEPSAVVILSAEDDPEDTIKPRLIAAGADESKVFIVRASRDKKGKRPVVLPEDVARLEALVNRTGAKLVIVDPLMAYLTGKTDAFRDHDVRRALLPLQEMAQRTGVALIVNRHLKKGDSAKAIYKGGGSIGIGGAARSVVVIAKDAEDPARRVLASVKLNIGSAPQSLAFRLTPWDGDPDYARVTWEGVSEQTADDLVAGDGRKSGATPEAESLAMRLLAHGEVRARDAYEQAEAQGINAKALQRAVKRLGADIYKKKDGWYWKGKGTPWSKVMSSSVPLSSCSPRGQEDKKTSSPKETLATIDPTDGWENEAA